MATTAPIAAPPPTPPPGGTRHALRALRSRNFALFLLGQALSYTGTWMQMVAQGVLVWELAHDELTLGLVSFASQFSAFVLAPLAGVLSDRWSRHRVILATQALALVQASALAILTLDGDITVAHIMTLSVALGLVSAFDIPMRQAFVVEMVDRREDLPSAIALNSVTFHGARMIGPVVAGALIPLANRLFDAPHAGIAACFVVNAVSYVAVLVALLQMRLQRPATTAAPRVPLLASLGEGVRYSLGSPPIRGLLVMLAAVTFVGMPYTVLMPAMADGLHGGAPELELACFGSSCLRVGFETTYGLLVASAGLGAMLGGAFLAARPSVTGLGRLIPVATAALGLGLVGFALAPSLIAAVPLLVAVGAGFMVNVAGSNTLLQTIVEDDKRGRVMAFYTMAFLGAAPLGSLAAGSLARVVGAPLTLVGSGVVALVAAVAFAVRRPRMGLPGRAGNPG